MRVFSAFLTTAARPGATGTFFQHLPECAAEVAKLDHLGWRTSRAALDGWSALWWPQVHRPEYFDLVGTSIQPITLPEGQLLVGPRDAIEHIAQAPGVETAPLLPELERQMSEPPPDSSS